MRNHWLRKKVAREEFGKCICRIYYKYGFGNLYNWGHVDLPLQLKLNWANSVCDYLNIAEICIFDKSDKLIWSQAVGSTLRTDAELMLDFEGLFINGYKAKDLFK